MVLDRGDGKRPVGTTVFLFFRGKSLILDFTAIDPGSAARSAEVRKRHMYEGLCDRYIFYAIVTESSGVFGRDTVAIISRLGHLTTSISGERREAEFFRQRLLLATLKRPICYISLTPKLMIWGCLVLSVNRILVKLHYVNLINA